MPTTNSRFSMKSWICLSARWISSPFGSQIHPARYEGRNHELLTQTHVSSHAHDHTPCVRLISLANWRGFWVWSVLQTPDSIGDRGMRVSARWMANHFGSRIHLARYEGRTHKLSTRTRVRYSVAASVPVWSFAAGGEASLVVMFSLSLLLPWRLCDDVVISEDTVSCATPFVSLVVAWDGGASLLASFVSLAVDCDDTLSSPVLLLLLLPVISPAAEETPAVVDAAALFEGSTVFPDDLAPCRCKSIAKQTSHTIYCSLLYPLLMIRVHVTFETPHEESDKFSTEKLALPADMELSQVRNYREKMVKGFVIKKVNALSQIEDLEILFFILYR